MAGCVELRKLACTIAVRPPGAARLSAAAPFHAGESCRPLHGGNADPAIHTGTTPERP
ncbi:hypothetical protein [Lysobacter gummosus]|uniref:hypothetical protein n=1 Tax=Lysobacter gummosus TaxID=262324 RepID=UPI00363E047F